MTPVRPYQPLAGTLAAAVIAASAVAQTSTGPTPQPIRPGLPGTAREELCIDRSPPLVREGAFVSAARGVLARGKSGRWYVVFDRDARGRQMPPMVILPSQHLAAMERIAARFESEENERSRTRILITGQVFAYQGQNYLLPTAPPILETTAPTQPAQPTTQADLPTEATVPSTGETPTPTADNAAVQAPKTAEAAADQPKPEPTIDQIISDLDRALGTRRATNPAATTVTEQLPSEGAGARVRPAGFMTARRGRIVRAANGEPTFVVDSGTAGEVPEPPMMLLPCTNLTAIESLTERLGESVTFTVSGQVTVYRGRNYLLPTTYTVNRTTDQVIPNQ